MDAATHSQFPRVWRPYSSRRRRRACSDTATAERLESTVDAKCLRREGGLYFLDLDRRWRIGATAMRIIALAESNGSRFRNL